jgi:rhamnogalacturonyl hydrolase YesR
MICRTIRSALIAAILFFSFTATLRAQAAQAVYSRDEVKMLMKRVMDFQVRAYGDTPTAAWTNWQAAPFWAGVMACYRATDDAAFYDATKKWGEGTAWKLNRRTFHADDIAVGQAYIEMYLKDKKPEMLADVKARIDQYFDKKTVTSADVAHGGAEPVPMTGRTLWWWCDALFMAPPAMAQLYTATGEQKYLDLMHPLYWDCVAYLFDESEGLFFRDDRFFFDKTKSPTGKKVFWGRGNGWVYAGLIRILDHLPATDPQREKYLALYRKMTDALMKLQGADGMWRSSLNDPAWVPEGESSGTGFFTFGLLAGINRGYLDREKYLPAALKGWAGLCGVVNANGSVGFTQPVSDRPVAPTAESVKDYSQGGFLLSAAELYTLHPPR